MKKLIIVAAMFAMSVASAATYQVYEFEMNAQTTKAKGHVSTTCGDDYFYRDAGKQKIKGIIAGCGCAAIEADGSCVNALVVLWNETTKTQITNASLNTWIVQRIGKKGEKIEHIAEIETEQFSVFLSGLGKYKDNKNDSNLSYVSSISGKFAGHAEAPYGTVKNSCSQCCSDGYSDQTVATAVCESGVCADAENGSITPFFGTYSLKYSAIKSKRLASREISNESLGVPQYVDLSKGYIR